MTNAVATGEKARSRSIRAEYTTRAKTSRPSWSGRAIGAFPWHSATEGPHEAVFDDIGHVVLEGQEAPVTGATDAHPLERPYRGALGHPQPAGHLAGRRHRTGQGDLPVDALPRELAGQLEDGSQRVDDGLAAHEWDQVDGHHGRGPVGVPPLDRTESPMALGEAEGGR